MLKDKCICVCVIVLSAKNNDLDVHQNTITIVYGVLFVCIIPAQVNMHANCHVDMPNQRRVRDEAGNDDVRCFTAFEICIRVSLDVHHHYNRT